MSNTYTQIHIQFVFAVRNRRALIHESWENELQKYITGIVQDNNHKMLQINNMPDHLHCLVGLRPNQSCSDLMKLVKSGSSSWINNNNLSKTPFSWQDGYGAFSYSKKDIENVIRYIQNQKIHHRKESFLDEYRRFLKEFEVEYDERYIFRELT